MTSVRRAENATRCRGRCLTNNRLGESECADLSRLQRTTRLVRFMWRHHPRTRGIRIRRLAEQAACRANLVWPLFQVCIGGDSIAKSTRSDQLPARYTGNFAAQRVRYVVVVAAVACHLLWQAVCIVFVSLFILIVLITSPQLRWFVFRFDYGWHGGLTVADKPDEAPHHCTPVVSLSILVTQNVYTGACATVFNS